MTIYGRKLVRKGDGLVFEDDGQRQLQELWKKIHDGDMVCTAIAITYTSLLNYYILHYTHVQFVGLENEAQIRIWSCTHHIYIY
jgi:hypothetical protein